MGFGHVYYMLFLSVCISNWIYSNKSISNMKKFSPVLVQFDNLVIPDPDKQQEIKAFATLQNIKKTTPTPTDWNRLKEVSSFIFYDFDFSDEKTFTQFNMRSTDIMWVDGIRHIFGVSELREDFVRTLRMYVSLKLLYSLDWFIAHQMKRTKIIKVGVWTKFTFQSDKYLWAETKFAWYRLALLIKNWSNTIYVNSLCQTETLQLWNPIMKILD